ncbi:probable glutamate receptor [Panulirus ornatus]|uniref:probable glutamate receptor n=1 Tax=Panulirus ornatus TaxID=150431 RepID=UPI003A83870D
MALNGTDLRVAAGVWVPWVVLKQDQQGFLTATGVLIDLVNILAAKLNFTYTLVEAIDGEWGRLLPNGSTTGMIGMCQRQEVDMALGPFSITYVRSKIIDFSEPLYIDTVGIFLPRPRLERDLAGFTKPLAWKVWMVLLILLVVSMTLGALLNWLAFRWSLPNVGKAVGGHLFQPIWIWKALLVEPIEVPPKSLTGRVLLGSWLVAAGILGAAYQGVLTSLLAVPRVSVPVDSLRDLVNYGRIPWAIEQGTSLHQLFGDAESGVHKQISDGSFLVTSLFEERERMKEERFAIICDFFSMKKIMSDDYSNTGMCNYYIAKEVIWSTAMAFAFPKGSRLPVHFNKWIVMMKECGLVSRDLQQLTANATACMVPPGKEGGVTTLVLSFADLAGIFLLLAAGLTMGLSALLLEKLNCSVKADSPTSKSSDLAITTSR